MSGFPLDSSAIFKHYERKSLIMPDRSQATFEAWLRAHREVEIISRDRAGEYAAAARKGAPQAQQVADRFHLLLNLRDGLKKLMERKQASLPEIEEDTLDAIAHQARGRVKEVSAPQASQHARPERHFRTM